MKTITVGSLKVQCLSLINEIIQKGEPIVVTKNGRPVAKLIPYYEEVSTVNPPSDELLQNMLTPLKD